jgi:hypothetical protein
MPRSFCLEWGGSASLTVDEIWPNGDAPADPTRDDVIQAMRNSASSVSQLCRDWNLDIEGVEVDGKDSGLR